MEKTVIRMAAPTLAGIKTGCLFPYYYESREELGKEMGRLNRLLIPCGLRLVLLRLTERSALLYLYRQSELEKDLKDRTASELLRCAGYPCPNCGACLCHLLKRFQNGEEFPHEIGLFLSYPPEDVKGFLTDAPLAIIISCEKGSELSAGLACQNMSVEAQLLGYGSKIISSPTIALNGERREEFAELLGIPEGQSAVAVLLVGREDTSVDKTADAYTGATSRSPMSEKVSYVKAS